jgi:hypothetical protein
MLVLRRKGISRRSGLWRERSAVFAMRFGQREILRKQRMTGGERLRDSDVLACNERFLHTGRNDCGACRRSSGTCALPYEQTRGSAATRGTGLLRIKRDRPPARLTVCPRAQVPELRTTCLVVLPPVRRRAIALHSQPSTLNP